MINTPALQPNHPLLQDGLNDGFRAPDLGWVGAQGSAEGYVAEAFNGGSLLFSNFWIGPSSQAKLFAEALIKDFQAWLTVVVPEEAGDEFAPVVSVSYWEDGETNLAMVAAQSLTSDFMIDHIPDEFQAFNTFTKQMTQVLFDGNDNSPYEALSEISTLEDIDQEAFMKMIFSSTQEEERPDLHKFLEDQG